MRFIVGIVVGCLLTVGVAYVHDSALPGTPPPATEEAAADGPMVNWAVVNRNLHGVNGWVQSQWAWISSRLNHAG